MTYTIQLNLDIDDENVVKEEDLRDVIEEVFRSINSSIRDFKLLNVTC